MRNRSQGASLFRPLVVLAVAILAIGSMLSVRAGAPAPSEEMQISAPEDAMSPMGRVAYLRAQAFAEGLTAPKGPGVHLADGEIDPQDDNERPAGGQAETSIAVDSTGMHIVIGVNDTRGFSLNPLSVSGFQYSDDGGVTFVDGGQLPVTTGTSAIGATLLPQVFGDPEVKYLGGCTFAYISILLKKFSATGTAQTMGVHRSTDCGHTWVGPFEIPSATNPHGLLSGANARDSADKEFADVDPDTGRVMMTWSNFTSTAFAAGGVEISSTFSDDLATATPPTWSARKILANAVNDGQASLPRFVGNGSSNVYVVWRRNFPGLTNATGFVRSTDNGVTWTAPVNTSGTFFTPDYILGNDRINTSPGLAVDNSTGPNAGNIYVVYGNNANHDGADIAFQRSTDGGVSFSTPIFLDSRPGADRSQWFPWVTADSTTGRVYVHYYDQGIATSGDLTEVSYQYSDDGGLTWSRPVNLAARPFKAGWGNDTGQPNIGDYNQAVAQNGEYFALWAGTELLPFTDGQPTTQFNTPDVFFARTPALRVALSLGAVTFTDGNANGFIDAGETVHLQMGLRNYVTNPMSAASITGIGGTLSTSTPGVSITSPASSYSSLAPNASGSNLSDYVLTTASSFVAGTPIELALAVASDQGGTTLLHTQATGTPAPTVLLSENFNGVAPGVLPAGWATSHAGGTNTIPWTTNNTFAGTSSNAAFHINANDAANPTRFERLFSPLFVVPANAQWVTIDMDVAYDTEDDPSFSVLAYDGFTLRITDQTPGRTLRSILAEAFDEELTTDGFFHFPKHFPRNSSTAYFEDMSVWAGDSAGFKHVHMKFPGMAGSTAQLRFEFAQDSSATCADVRPGHACGVMVDNVVVQSVVAAQADLSLTKTATPTDVVNGDPVTYTIAVHNNGPSAAQAVTVTDLVPASLMAVSGTISSGTLTLAGNLATATISSIASGATETITISANLADCGLAEGSPITNTASGSSTTPDNDASNNTASATIIVHNPPPTISCPGDITVTAAFGAPTAIVSYTVGSSDNCPGQLVVSSPASGSDFPVGSTTVNANAVDSGGATASCSFQVNVQAPTITTVDPAAGQYSDLVTLVAHVTPAVLGSQTATGFVMFSVNGNPAGTAPIDAMGVAHLPYTIIQQASSWLIQATFSSTNPYFLGSMGTSFLTVSREDATVTLAPANPSIVKVNTPGGTAGPITLCVNVNEVNDGSAGNISFAAPVNFTLVPVGVGATLTATGIPSGGGVGGTLTACATFTNVPVNVYDVTISLDGPYYSGTEGTVLAVYDPALGFTTGGGTVTHNGIQANFGFNAKYLANGTIQGSFIYVEHRPGGDVEVKSTAISALSIVGKYSIFTGRATVNGAGDDLFRVTAIDNGEPGTTDQFGLWTWSSPGVLIPGLTFPPLTLTSGNIQSQQQKKFSPVQ
jgi:uncharacterized repeat protein (TIGR01451 family)